ncbi:4-alpha-glucanotransferase [Desulfobulbus rhabdoformis]|uniref:4-alpha-glucanotransferase n=1 Tax=Desulfobulbus rhabdoformis TaxID=34032 RepID=UPI001965BDA9|nr:4-alpha-glucanotransferase [Desulfobulbus rhabdoformis]MBM9613586.1 4-alpha-glucanotransferase [Desulfobulbus rhabdoformis]
MNNCTSINILRQRSSGILLPIFSLPGPYGIGEIGKEAFDFIDFLNDSKQKSWQILPTTPVAPLFGNSPYMSFSAFAGSPLLIAAQGLVEAGWLLETEIPSPSFSPFLVEYDKIESYKKELLQKAWRRFSQKPSFADTLEQFASTHPWAQDYALFVALKNKMGNAPWYEWPEGLRQHDSLACAQAQKDLLADVHYHLFTQYVFMKQWQALRDYARAHEVQLIGDLPIYVALDSVDVWVNQSIFQLDENTGEPTRVAGVPPDYFSATGQRWGNPLYRWNSANTEVETQLYAWWEQRLQHNFNLVDVVRIDHFRGFESYWSVPAEEETALNGSWQPGPGENFFREMTIRLGEMNIIAEDLGVITKEVEELRDSLDYPGMKILLFAFDGNPENSYLPYSMGKKSVVYTGTHDNDTAVGWYLSSEVAPEAKKQAKLFAHCSDDNAGSFHRELIYLAYGSPANLAIIPMQDVLGYGNDCRMNTPGTTTGNWQWRLTRSSLTPELSTWLGQQVELFGRDPQPKLKILAASQE